MLMNCKECNKEISTKSKRCVSCGATSPKKPLSPGMKVLSFFCYSLTALAVYGFANDKTNYYDLAHQDALSGVVSCEVQSEQYFRDPSSVSFHSSDMHFNSQTNVASVGYTAKNAFNANVSGVVYCKLQHTKSDGWLVTNVSFN